MLSFAVAKPPDTLHRRTMVGAADRVHDVERGTVRVGTRLGAMGGEWLKVP